MPYHCEALPDPLNAMWMPYAEMYEEFGRELANAINAFSNQVHSLAAWAALIAPMTDKRKMTIVHEFVDTLACKRRRQNPSVKWPGCPVAPE